MGKIHEQSSKYRIECLDGIQEGLETLRDLRSYNMTDSYMEGLNKKIKAVEKHSIVAEFSNALFVASAQMILKFGIGTVAVVGSALLIKGEISLLTFFMFLLVVTRMYEPLQISLQNLAAVISADVNCKRMDEILSHEEQTGSNILTNKGYDINFDHVAFSYENGEQVLSDVSFTAKQGEVTALIGPSGGGKTTVGRFEYTGALVMGRRHTVAVGSKVTRKTAERDVVIRKNINPPIITEEEYEVASASIMFMTKPEYRGAKDFLLKGKVRCGNCHRALAYTDGGIHPKIYCPHKAQAGRYSHCPEDAYPVSVIEGHIWYSLKRILRILDSVQRKSEEKYTDNSFTGKRQQRVLESELEKLKNERIHQYEAYAEGVLSREKYITVKKQLTEKIEKIQSEQKALASVIIEEERYRSRIRTAVQQLEVQIEREKLTKEIIDTMIDTVYVYDKKRIEVILKFDDVLQKVISEYTEGAKGA